MSKFHIKPDGTVGVCNATKGGCPYGSEQEHFSTKEEAYKVSQDKMEAELGKNSKFKSKKKIKQEAYQKTRKAYTSEQFKKSDELSHVRKKLFAVVREIEANSVFNSLRQIDLLPPNPEATIKENYVKILLKETLDEYDKKRDEYIEVLNKAPEPEMSLNAGFIPENREEILKDVMEFSKNYSNFRGQSNYEGYNNIKEDLERVANQEKFCNLMDNDAQLWDDYLESHYDVYNEWADSKDEEIKEKFMENKYYSSGYGEFMRLHPDADKDKAWEAYKDVSDNYSNFKAEELLEMKDEYIKGDGFSSIKSFLKEIE